MHEGAQADRLSPARPRKPPGQTQELMSNKKTVVSSPPFRGVCYAPLTWRRITNTPTLAGLVFLLLLLPVNRKLFLHSSYQNTSSFSLRVWSYTFPGCFISTAIILMAAVTVFTFPDHPPLDSSHGRTLTHFRPDSSLSACTEALKISTIQNY